MHRDPEPGVVAVFQVDPDHLVPDEYGYEAGARNVEFRVLGGLRLEDLRGSNSLPPAEAERLRDDDARILAERVAAYGEEP